MQQRLRLGVPLVRYSLLRLVKVDVPRSSNSALLTKCINDLVGSPLLCVEGPSCYFHVPLRGIGHHTGRKLAARQS